MRTQISIVFCVVFLLIQPAIAAPDKPRVASLNLCADQLILLLADPNQISSLSQLSTEVAGSLYAEQAANYPQNNATAEDIVGQAPDFVIAGEFTVNYTPRLLQALGVPIRTLPVANSLEDAINNITLVADWLDQKARGDTLIDQMRNRLHELPVATANPPRAAVYDANGYTVGTDTMRGEALQLAGWANVATELGFESYGSLSLEALVHLWPDAVIESPYAAGYYSRGQQLTNHPAIDKSGFNPQRIRIASNKTVCAGPWSIDVIDTLIEARLSIN